jgi:hypothetical protein
MKQVLAGYFSHNGIFSLDGQLAALRRLGQQFSTSDSSASPAARTVSFQVTDSVGGVSNTATRTIDVIAAQP